MYPRIRLYRIGSDPEFLFVSPADFDFIIKPAKTVLGVSKEQGAQSFIGMDARPILGELRPSPTRNLKHHLYEIAYALDATQTYLNDKHPNTYILAYPALHGETLGGHLHTSFFTDSDVERSTWGRTMNWLLQPFESWIQPWIPRELRNAQYGSGADTNDDLVRVGPSTTPKRKPASLGEIIKVVYVHWEYRLPSTWLHHPCLAYAYLALAKFTALNFQAIAERSYYFSREARNTLAQIIPEEAEFHHFRQLKTANNDTSAQILLARLADLYTDTPVVTKDLMTLQRAIDTCGRRREAWFRSPGPIALDEWRKLLV